MVAMLVFILGVTAAEGIAILVATAVFDLSGNAKLAVSLAVLVAATLVGAEIPRRCDRRGR
ncbi:hypothetical protein [Candidatus Poriferisocius sp.]|uniref:hypothetical protein n=1 Tax=Candidatus Poriferisocius sp. TaxID=3101276 RepID=UPI003B525BED